MSTVNNLYENKKRKLNYPSKKDPENTYRRKCMHILLGLSLFL